jgi:cytochrome c oxidase subunit 3
MEIGTFEPVTETREIRRRRTNLTTGSGGNGGRGRGNNGGGGGDDSGNDHNADIFGPSKARVFTAFLLVVVLMTFGGLCAAYIVTATNKAIEWRPFDLPIQVWISTIIILVSSAVYHRAKVALDDGNQPVARRWLIATAALGAAFISSQLLAWLELSQRGLYFRGNPYAGFFYILTAVHALHVLGGVIALGSIVLHSWNPIASHEMWQRVRSLAQTVGWYWHFMGGVWLVLFVLLGFWK